MKTVVTTGMNGKKVTTLVPENEKDAKKIAKMVEDGKADGRVSHGDMRGETK